MDLPLKNIAIVAHVDHGKTTLMDGLLRQSGSFAERQVVVDRVLDSGELERERGITIRAKNCAIIWGGHKINLLDTPGHADFGGEVERSLMMADGILLLVDAAEGPLPQTRFVLQKAMERNLKIACVINKIDRPDARPNEVKTEVEELFLQLASLLNSDFDLDIPFLYASSRDGWAAKTLDDPRENLHPILDLMASDFFPPPKISPGKDFQMLVTNLSYSPYLGPLVVGRIQAGEVKRLTDYVRLGENGTQESFRTTAIEVFDKLEMAEVESAKAGEIVILAGCNHAKIGDTICSPENPSPLPRISVDPPTVSIEVSVNTSPFSGKEGTYLTSRKLEEFLLESCRLNVALQYQATDDPKVFILKGRGELQLAIVFEELRRQGFELMLARPQVLYQTGPNGEKLEPFEKLVIDIPQEHIGIVTEKLGLRKGTMVNMAPLGEGRTRMEFEIPSRGLIGYRGAFMTDTRGEGLLSTQFLGHRPYVGDFLSRQNGAIVSDRAGKATPYALFNLLPLGEQFVRPGDQVYEGMVIGEHTRKNDTNVNCCREKHLSSVRTAGKDTNVILPPIQDLTLEKALDWIDEDEWVEVTPKKIRIRKKILPLNQRSIIR